MTTDLCTAPAETTTFTPETRYAFALRSALSEGAEMSLRDLLKFCGVNPFSDDTDFITSLVHLRESGELAYRAGRYCLAE